MRVMLPLSLENFQGMGEMGSMWEESETLSDRWVIGSFVTIATGRDRAGPTLILLWSA